MNNNSIRYKHYDLGDQPAGTVVEIGLSCINNIKLMDDVNIALYKESKVHRFQGGKAQKTPTKITITRAGHWHLVVDKEGLAVLANSHVRIFRPAGLENWVRQTEPPPEQQVVEQVFEPPQPVATITQPAAATAPLVNQNIDALTGLYNREAFEECLAKIFNLNADLSAYAAIFLSIDDLKAFNDQHGRQAGDAALESIASVIRRNVNGNDFVARTGGLEFALLTKCGSEDVGKMIGARLVAAIGGLNHENAATGQVYGTLEASFGLAIASTASSADDFYAKAENALAATKVANSNAAAAYKTAVG